MKIKRLIGMAILALMICSTGIYASDTTKYEIADLGLSLALPAEYSYVFTRDMDADDPNLADLGLTKEELFNNDSLYLEALTEDQNIELVVTMTDTDWSNLYYDFNDLDNNDLMEMAHTALMSEDASADMDFTNYSVFEGNEQAKFIKAEGTLTADDANGYAIQYVTVINGNAYTITFDFYNGTITDDEDALTEQVVSSIAFHHIQAKEAGTSNVLYIVIIGVMAVIIVGLIFVIRKKKYTIDGTGNNGAEQVVTPQESSVPEAVAATDESEAEPEAEHTEAKNKAEDKSE